MSTCFDRAARQRGNVLLEALVSVAVTGLIGAGFAHLASGMMNNQRNAKVEQLAVAGLRDQLQNNGVALCTSAKVSIPLLPANGENHAGQGSTPNDFSSQVDATVKCADSQTVQVSVAGIPHDVTAPLKVTLSVAAADLGVRDADDNAAPLQMASGS